MVKVEELYMQYRRDYNSGAAQNTFTFMLCPCKHVLGCKDHI